jgi:hypothetical protein
MINEETTRIKDERGEERFKHGHFPSAIQVFDDLVSKPQLADFLTLTTDPVN